VSFDIHNIFQFDDEGASSTTTYVPTAAASSN